MKKFKIYLPLALITLATGVYYFCGSSDSFLTKSYFSERRLRHLLFLETHEPVDYADVLRNYEKLLKEIRLGTKINQPAIYKKAIARTKITIQIISHLRQYNAMRSIAELEAAHRLYTQVFTEGLNEYGFYSVYLDNERITEEWFRDELLRAEIKSRSLE